MRVLLKVRTGCNLTFVAYEGWHLGGHWCRVNEATYASTLVAHVHRLVHRLLLLVLLLGLFLGIIDFKLLLLVLLALCVLASLVDCSTLELLLLIFVHVVLIVHQAVFRASLQISLLVSQLRPTLWVETLK